MPWERIQVKKTEFYADIGKVRGFLGESTISRLPYSQATANRMIITHENRSAQRYAGFVQWVDPSEKPKCSGWIARPSMTHRVKFHGLDEAYQVIDISAQGPDIGAIDDAVKRESELPEKQFCDEQATDEHIQGFIMRGINVYRGFMKHKRR